MQIPELLNIPIEKLKAQRAQLVSALSSLDDAIRILEGNPEKPMDWKNNARECLKNNGRPMRTIEILNCLFWDEPDKLNDESKKKNYLAALSLALNNLCDKNELDRASIPGYKGYFYGASTWFISKGLLKLEIKQRLIASLWNNTIDIAELTNLAKIDDTNTAIDLGADLL